MSDPRKPTEPGPLYRAAIIKRTEAIRNYKIATGCKAYPFEVDLDEQAPGTGDIIDPDRPDKYFVELFQSYSVYAREFFQRQQARKQGLAS